MKVAWRDSYELYSELRSVYVGPPGRTINGYERLGRTIVGALLTIVYLWLSVAFLATCLGVWAWLAVQAFHGMRALLR